MVPLLRNYWQLTVSQWTQQLWPVTSQITQLNFIYSWPNPKECIGTSGFQIKGWRQEMEVMWVKLLYWSWIFRHLYLSIYFSVISLLLFPTFLQKNLLSAPYIFQNRLIISGLMQLWWIVISRHCVSLNVELVWTYMEETITHTRQSYLFI